jgi:hypothetical protein
VSGGGPTPLYWRRAQRQVWGEGEGDLPPCEQGENRFELIACRRFLVMGYASTVPSVGRGLSAGYALPKRGSVRE